MNRLALIFMLTACDWPPVPTVAPAFRGNVPAVWHDDVRSVTCWIQSQGGPISCLPDSALMLDAGAR